MLMDLTETNKTSEIRVLSLRNKNFRSCLEQLANCQNLQIAYLEGNQLQERDLTNLGPKFFNLLKLDLSRN